MIEMTPLEDAMLATYAEHIVALALAGEHEQSEYYLTEALIERDKVVASHE